MPEELHWGRHRDPLTSLAGRLSSRDAVIRAGFALFSIVFTPPPLRPRSESRFPYNLLGLIDSA